MALAERIVGAWVKEGRGDVPEERSVERRSVGSGIEAEAGLNVSWGRLGVWMGGGREGEMRTTEFGRSGEEAAAAAVEGP